jgi:hypothetical protein
MNLPTTNKEFYELTGNKEKLLQFLWENDIVKKTGLCPNKNCPRNVDNKLVIFNDRLHYRCNFKICQRRWSAKSNIFNYFEKTNMSVAQILEIIWYWSWNTTAKDTIAHTCHAKETILGWFKKIRDALTYCLNKAPPMGGPGWKIQIDESLFQGRRKYNRGRLRKGDKKPKVQLDDANYEDLPDENNPVTATSKRNYGNRVTGPWVFGLVAQKVSDLKNDAAIKFKNEIARNGVIRQYQAKAKRRILHKDTRKINTAQYRVYDKVNKHKYTSNILSAIKKHQKEVRMFVVEKRDAETLMPIILRNAKKGTQINSDEWRAYSKLKDHGYKHFTVNHSLNFVDPASKQHTQLIECLWLVAKSTIMKRRRGTVTKNLNGHLAEEWFRSIHRNPSIIFLNILLILKEFAYIDILSKTDEIFVKHANEKSEFKKNFLGKAKPQKRGKKVKRLN